PESSVRPQLGHWPGRTLDRSRMAGTPNAQGATVASVGRGEDLDAVVGDEERVLELGGALAVDRDRRPVVVPDLVLPGAHGDHRLDRERHARLDDRGGPRVVVVRDLQVGVELLGDAVADERPDDAVALALGVRLDGPADPAHLPARPGG